MSNDNMGNLEKLGILVIVILVVVVGVVAITPSDTLFPEERVADLPGLPGDRYEPLPAPATNRFIEDARDHDVAGGDLPDWIPDDEPKTHVDLPVVPKAGQIVLGKPQRTSPAPVSDVPAHSIPVHSIPVHSIPAVARFRDVTVRKNDNMWRIAERELGTGRDWKKIAAANPSVDPDRLSEGQTLRVPLAARATPEASQGGAAAAGQKTYVVQGGDTPMGLSQKFYGTTRHHQFLLRHNHIDDVNGLQKGMTIEVPAAPRTSSDPAPSGNSRSSRDSRAPGVPASVESGVRTYLVQKGDLPSRVALDQLGDASRWREILELNGIADERGLIAGTRIRLPR